MNSETGHLIRLGPDAPLPSGYTSLPPELQNDADEILGDNNDAYVQRKGSTKAQRRLAAWAAQDRHTRRKARKVATASRKRNRKP